MRTIHRYYLLATAISLGLVGLSGCIAIPAVLGANMVAKSGTQTVVVTGEKYPGDLFREAAIKSGGTLTSSTSDYAKAEFSATLVKVELQTVKSGEYQLIGSSNTTVARSWEFSDNIGETTQKIADHLSVNGYKVVSNTRNRGL